MGGYFSSLKAGTRQIAHEIDCDLDDPEMSEQISRHQSSHDNLVFTGRGLLQVILRVTDMTGLALVTPKLSLQPGFRSRHRSRTFLHPRKSSYVATQPGERTRPGPHITIYEMLRQDSIRNIVTISSGALPGSVIVLLAIDYIARTTRMGWMFVALAGLFAINGGTFFVTFETDQHTLTVTLYVLAQVIFNLGPSTIIFMLPAEPFATKYRGTFYGLAAASGKLGAITTLLITNLAVYGGE
ncbi:uncharacterized protein F4812DRAFT_456169 [Daldinia caldariorum]|uniref:uncharacterized protein n=1 Tax=Daldinia caldariorum TaxID=326644 RepID=UPI0020081A21|nr:uncharacterized protein F4812DRAFT_456169 [Daldinia caldariorum]KAI1472073.1 hypothetical protein F4812DRAFT_456169 [Daldinia caldariorum]